MGSLDSLRVDQVGSLLRPEWLKDAYRKLDHGEISEDDLKITLNRAVSEVISKQEAVKYPVLTDGEFRRLNFQDSFALSVSGIDAPPNTMEFEEAITGGGVPLQRWDSGHARPGPAVLTRRAANERLKLVRNQPLHEYRFSASRTTRPVKVTLVGPDRILQRFDYQASKTIYPTIDAFVSDVVNIQRRIVEDLVSIGCPYVQIDEPGYTAYVDPASLEQMRSRGESPTTNLLRSIDADNAVIAGFPNVTFGIHICRGNQRSMWHREGGYDAIAEALFSGLKFQRLLLEYDSDRAGGFEPLRFVPKGRMVVLGLVSSKVAQLETADEIKRRIEAAAQYCPIEQLALSPQCGFASSIPGNLLSENDQWRKLELVLKVSREVWG